MKRNKNWNRNGWAKDKNLYGPRICCVSRPVGVETINIRACKLIMKRLNLGKIYILSNSQATLKVLNVSFFSRSLHGLSSIPDGTGKTL